MARYRDQVNPLPLPARLREGAVIFGGGKHGRAAQGPCLNGGIVWRGPFLGAPQMHSPGPRGSPVHFYQVADGSVGISDRQEVQKTTPTHRPPHILNEIARNAVARCLIRALENKHPRENRRENGKIPRRALSSHRTLL